MQVFAPLYARTIAWSRHRHAPRLLFGLSLIEAIFFPVPPEVMLAPMSLAHPRRAFSFAATSLAGSLLGALAGYGLGHFAYHAVQPLIDAWLAREGRDKASFSPVERLLYTGIVQWAPSSTIR